MAESKRVRKILTVTLEIEVNGKTTRGTRLSNTYQEIVDAALTAAREHMPQDSIEQVTSHARWEYRHWDPQPLTYPKGDHEELEYPEDFDWGDEA